MVKNSGSARLFNVFDAYADTQARTHKHASAHTHIAPHTDTHNIRSKIAAASADGPELPALLCFFGRNHFFTFFSEICLFMNKIFIHTF